MKLSTLTLSAQLWYMGNPGVKCCRPGFLARYYQMRVKIHKYDEVVLSNKIYLVGFTLLSGAIHLSKGFADHVSRSSLGPLRQISICTMLSARSREAIIMCIVSCGKCLELRKDPLSLLQLIGGCVM